MIMQPIRAQSLKFVATLHANEPLLTVCEREETFFAKYRSTMGNEAWKYFIIYICTGYY